ncbi:MAG: hypothetical protein ACI4WX_09105 [Aristaeellaceae bacterium]
MNDDVYHTLHAAFCQAAKAKKTVVSAMFQLSGEKRRPYFCTKCTGMAVRLLFRPEFL